jgi:hypothetical protein
MPALLMRTSIAMPHDSTSSPAWRACLSEARSTMSVLISTSGASSAIASCVWCILHLERQSIVQELLAKAWLTHLSGERPARMSSLGLC